MPAISADLKAMAETAERFAQRELAPRAIDLDNYPFAPFNRAALDSARAAGLVGVNLPEAAGGLGLGMEALAEVLFALAREDASFAAVILADAFAHCLICAAGRGQDGQRPDLVGVPLFDLPLEPQTGLVAAAEADGFLLRGKVEYVTLAPVAGALVLPAVLEGAPALFLMDAGVPGLTLSSPVVSLGLRGCPAADVTLAGVRISSSGLLTRDAGVLPATAAPYRAAVAALAAGIADGCFRTARAYTESRYQGGRMIIEYDMIRQMLAGIAVAAATGQALFRSLARAADQGERPPLLEAGAVLAAEQATAATTDGVQCLGGYGYMEDYGQEKRMRDARQVQGIFGPAPLRRLRLLEEILRV